jgi:predicted acetyltransferase
MSLSMRPITPAECRAFWYAIHVSFGERTNDHLLERWQALVEYDRTLAVFDPADHIVATAGAFSFDLTLPGATTLPVPGVTWVGVHPTHRRQGLLTQLMARQLEDTQARGEAIATLFASESSIYSRFGYGQATQQCNFEIDRRDARFAGSRTARAAGHLTLIDPEEAGAVFPAVYDRVRRQQTGAVTRSPEFWAMFFQGDAEPAEGFGPMYYVTYSRAAADSSDRIDGVASYRIRPNWQPGFPAHTLQVNELWATTPEAYAGLWRYLFSVDLVGTINAVRRPVDEPLRWLLSDPRRLRVTRLVDELWVRLLDIPAALSARRYPTSDTLVLKVADAFRPQTAGTYRLEAEPEGATCTVYSGSDSAVDLELEVADLGSAYLGAVSFSALAQAGRVVEARPEALARADLLFSTARAPYCGTPF